MTNPQTHCDHNCKGHCNALDIALNHERQAILEYAAFRDECNYPDVRAMLNELILRQEKTLRLLEETKAALHARFEVLDQVQESFEP
ncbi:MAG: hypothetical protein KGZ58_03995 [Ignavibacteriales bacterium]|nr:hypothetical protein [Ignavibacteriales bacterium]